MSTLTPLHLDVLAEVFNVGAGRAAASLSEIVGDEVLLSVPMVEVRRSDEIDHTLLSMNSPRFGAVSQKFSGALDAEALLLFTEAHALEIVREMMGSQMRVEELAEFEQEAMCELGNIILNACISAMADMLHLEFQCGLPDYTVAGMDHIFQRLVADAQQAYLLLLHIDLSIEKRHSEGHLIFLLGTTSFDALVERVERFLGGAT